MAAPVNLQKDISDCWTVFCWKFWIMKIVFDRYYWNRDFFVILWEIIIAIRWYITFVMCLFNTNWQLNTWLLQEKQIWNHKFSKRILLIRTEVMSLSNCWLPLGNLKRTNSDWEVGITILSFRNRSRLNIQKIQFFQSVNRVFAKLKLQNSFKNLHLE